RLVLLSRHHYRGTDRLDRGQDCRPSSGNAKGGAGGRVATARCPQAERGPRPGLPPSGRRDNSLTPSAKEAPRMIAPLLPMLATSALPFDSVDYSFEVKWDGVRALAAVERGHWRLWGRALADYSP